MTTYWTGQNFTAGQTLQFSYTWNSSASLATGTYSVDIGVFNADLVAQLLLERIGWIDHDFDHAATARGADGVDGHSKWIRRATLSWTASSGATSYNVYRGTASGAEGTTPIAKGITTTSFTNTGLTKGQTYFYKVAAVNAGGTSALSNEASTQPAASAPLAPAGLTATRGRRKVMLAWTASAGATSYNVYRGTAAGAEGTTPVATGITATSYTNTGLTNGTPYFFKVATVESGETSGLSNEASATPGQ